MNFLKRLFTYLPSQSIQLRKFEISKSDADKLIDLGLFLLVVFLAVAYKAIKHS